MLFDITCEDQANHTTSTFQYDNVTNTIWDPTGKKLTLWNDDRFKEIKEPFVNRAPIFSPEKPLKKSHNINSLKIQLGLACNYNCSYCCQAQHRLHTEKAPTIEDVNRFFDNLDKQQIKLAENGRVEFWGGEPLVYWKILKVLVPRIRDRWPTSRMSIVTNGSLLTKEIVDFLCEYRVHVTISHDGPGFKLRDKNNPLDDPKMKEVWLYLLEKSREIENDMGFNVVLSPANCNVIEIKKYFDEHFAPNVGFGFEGIVNYHSDQQTLQIFDKKKRDELTQSIFDVLTHQWGMGIWGSLEQRAVSLLEYLVHRTPSRAIACKCEMYSEKALAVTLKGDVLSCHNCDPKDFSIGTLENYDDVCNDAFLHWFLRPNCNNCFLLASCKGACPYLDHYEHSVNCKNEQILHGAIFAAVWFHITNQVIKEVRPHKENNAES